MHAKTLCLCLGSSALSLGGKAVVAATTTAARRAFGRVSSVARAEAATEPAPVAPQTMSPAAKGMVKAFQDQYWDRVPTAVKAVEVLDAALANGFNFNYWDHYAFRTFGVPGLGIESIGKAFEAVGYTKADDELVFPAKKLRANWYAPPAEMYDSLPRVFVSELKVEELSDKAQAIIAKYTGQAGDAAAPLKPELAMASSLGDFLPWNTPTYEDYKALEEESEYAAWTLVNAYVLNHTTVAVHRLDGVENGIDGVNALITDSGIKLNEAGGVLKVSPDGGLRQSSTVADKQMFKFADGDVHEVPSSYVEFAERLPLPEFAGIPLNQLKESQLRDGFEAASADKIFESTMSTATGN